MLGISRFAPHVRHCLQLYRNGSAHAFIDTFVVEKTSIAIYIVDGHYKQDQLRIRVLDESEKVSDAIAGGSSE